ncbi:MAG: glucose/arabinose dehydrogenase [Candidatus Latescibacterota bacterium]|jgi:glucose/arabinose dehydrogenase
MISHYLHRIILLAITFYIPTAHAQETHQSERHAFRIEAFAEGLGVPWGLAFLPDGRLLISEREGTLRIADSTGQLSAPIKNVPPVRAEGQGGLLDVSLHPQYDDNSWIYLSYSHAQSDGNSLTAIVRATLQNDQLTDLKIIYQGPSKDYSDHAHHYGSRIVFDEENYLYFSIGDRGQRPEAQSLNTANGKLHRLHDDGRVPVDNPFVKRRDAQSSIWSYGHRNPQGIAIDPQSGQIWAAEHGPRGGDELNLITRGQNYGWPTITYGINYNGTPITDQTHGENMLQPQYYWLPSIGVCAIEFYEGDRFAHWQNNLFVASLRFERLHRLQIEDGRVLHDEIVLEAGGRVRDIETGPDGFIYLALENPGRIVRIVPTD